MSRRRASSPVTGIVSHAREVIVRTSLTAYVAVDAAALGNPALALAIVGHTAPTAQAMPVIGLLVLARAIVLVPVGLRLRAPSSSSAADRAPPQRDDTWTTARTHAPRARTSHHARS